jgi:hypothetical protein
MYSKQVRYVRSVSLESIVAGILLHVRPLYHNRDPMNGAL